MKYNFLLDNNIYQPLTKLKNGDELDNFNLSIKKHPILKKISSQDINYSLTPFSIIEGIGITIPQPEILIPEKLSTVKKHKELVQYIKNEAEIYYSNLNQINSEEIFLKAQIQSKYTNEKAKIIEEIFIHRPIKLNGFNNYLIESLVFDFVCKYDFPKEIQKVVFSKYLIPTFFMNENITSRFSKFRIIKRLWDNSYHKLLHETSYPKEYINNLNNSMKLKKHSDYLDCEIIHFACIGDCLNGKYRPVFAFTGDNKETVINRIIVYKSMINLFLNIINENDYLLKKLIINDWKQGMIIFCNKDGSFNHSIDVSNIKAIE